MKLKNDNCWQQTSLNYIWLGNVATNIIWFCREVQNSLTVWYIQEWNLVVHNSPKCINYRTSGGGSGLRLNDGFDVKLEIVG